MGQRFDFTPTLDVQNIEIPITNGLTTLHAEFTITAPADPPGRIVSIFGLRGNLTGQGRKKRRPLHFNFTQGQDHQARWEAEPVNGSSGQVRGPQMPFPGTYIVTIEWSAISGIASATIEGRGTFLINGPTTQPITSGVLYIGGHVSKPPAPGELPVYTTPLGCNLKGYVAFNGEAMDGDGGDNENGNGEDDNSDGGIPAPPNPVTTPKPPSLPPPVIIPNPPNPPTFPDREEDIDINWSAFPEIFTALAKFYPSPSIAKLSEKISPILALLPLVDTIRDFDSRNPAHMTQVLLAILQIQGALRK